MGKVMGEIVSEDMADAMGAEALHPSTSGCVCTGTPGLCDN